MKGLELPSYVLAALTAAGGAIGYARTGSTPSLVAGTAVGLLCKSPVLFFFAFTICPPYLPPGYLATANSRPFPLDGLGGYRISNNEPYGIELSLLASVVLGGSSIPRAIRLQKPVPIALSLIAAYGAYTFGDAFRRTL